MNENKKIIIKVLNGIMQNQNINTILTGGNVQLLDETNGASMSIFEVMDSIQRDLINLDYMDEDKELIIKALNGIMQNQNINITLTGSNIQFVDKINGINMGVFEMMESIQMSLKDLV
ncbi:hypothetical protein [Tepidibacter aestuarii]|uniref:hypothetical protein n=1 Tax=Tepidibacter aestuarii TaxID=2925782 RepID=UPI0020BFDAA9|nr:hypothetical protein [Tepidibacter aestuarii]CAH2214898.1 protein of unknown function [Tepidibacter aestuarii]